jgi:endonuclease V-like protein UPF0215 family
MNESMHKPSHDWLDIPHAALDTVTKVVGDIAIAQSRTTLPMIDMQPPSAALIIRAALKHIHDSKVKSDEWEAVEKQLKMALQLYHQRWGVSID